MDGLNVYGSCSLPISLFSSFFPFYISCFHLHFNQFERDELGMEPLFFPMGSLRILFHLGTIIPFGLWRSFVGMNL